MISFMEAICNGYRIKLVEGGAEVADRHTGIFIYIRRGDFMLGNLEEAITAHAAAIEEVDRLYDGLTTEDLDGSSLRNSIHNRDLTRHPGCSPVVYGLGSAESAGISLNCLGCLKQLGE
jgi:hypothetical protein